jgi:hypothetical protein
MGDKTPYIFRSPDLGKTWKALADTSIKSYCHIIKQDLANPNLLFLGTESGLYISINGGQNWACFKGNIPKVPVMDMVIHPRDQSLVLATHGRGIMIIDDLNPLRQLSQEFQDADVKFIKTKDYVIREYSFKQEWNGDDEFIGQVPEESAPILYYMKKRHVFGDIYIEIYDPEGKLIKKLPAGTRKGINQVNWTIRLKPPKVPVSPQMEGEAMTGPNYSPGEYTVKLIRNNETLETKIRLLPDPKSIYSLEDREVRQTALMKTYHLLESLAYLDRQAKEIRDKAMTLAKEVPKPLARRLTEIATRMDTLHMKLVSTKEGKVTGEEKLREKIGFIYGSIMSYLGRPTDSQISGLDILSKDVDSCKTLVNDLLAGDLVRANKELVTLKKEEIKVISEEEFNKEP